MEQKGGGRQVTRGEAIYWIENLSGSWDGQYREARDMAIAALREQPRWISVKERLPEKYTTVLCYKDGQSRLGYYIGSEYSKGVAAFRHPKDQWAFGVTHWMPLPEPPKEEV